MGYNKFFVLKIFLLVCMVSLSGCGLFIINPLDFTGEKALNEYAADRQAILAKLEKYKQIDREEIRKDFGEPDRIRQSQLFRGITCDEIWEYAFPRNPSLFHGFDGFIFFSFEKGKVVLIDVM